MKYALASILLAGSAIAHADTAPGDSAPEPIWVEVVTATSTLADKHDAYNPTLTLVPKLGTDKKTGDLRYDSAWCEGKKDEGIGEAITIKLARPMVIPKVTIKAGVWMTQALFDANNQVTGLEIVTDDGRKLPVTASDKRTEVEVAVGGAPVSSVVVRITSVKKGKMNDSCISEITFGDDPIAVGFDANAVATFPAVTRELWATLFNPAEGATQCDAKVLAKYVDFPFSYVELENTLAHDEAKRFVKHRHTLPTAAAWEKACKANQFLGGGSTLPSTKIEAYGVGQLGVRFEMAMTSQAMRMVWRGGKWRLATFE